MLAAVMTEATGITGPRMLSFADKLGNYASCGHLRNAVALKRSVAPKKGRYAQGSTNWLPASAASPAAAPLFPSYPRDRVISSFSSYPLAGCRAVRHSSSEARNTDTRPLFQKKRRGGDKTAKKGGIVFACWSHCLGSMFRTFQLLWQQRRSSVYHSAVWA